MKTLSFPGNSIGSLLSDSSEQSSPPIAIPTELAARKASLARRTVVIDRQRHRYAIVAGLVVVLAAILYLVI